ncbi:MAG: hypothetical protein LBP28_07335 [Coriobacteriales bacterium]|jgi:hypothetical protein|nr:hypothetical protein [Coriobacteriales bacterium]
MREHLSAGKLVIVALVVTIGLSLGGCARFFQAGSASASSSSVSSSLSAEQRAALVNEGKTERLFNTARGDYEMLTAFMRQMPKGAALNTIAAPAADGGSMAVTQGATTAILSAPVQLSEDASGEELAAAYQPLFTYATQERIGYLEIIATPSNAQLAAIVEVLGTVHDDFLETGEDWQLAVDFVYPLDVSSLLESPEAFQATLDGAVEIYLAKDSPYVAIAVMPPASGSLDVAQTAVLLDAIDQTWQTVEASSDSASSESGASDSASSDSAATVKPLRLIYPNANWSSVAEDGSFLPHNFNDLLEKGHPARLDGLSSLLTQPDGLSLADQLREKALPVTLSLPASTASGSAPGAFEPEPWSSSLALLHSAGVATILTGPETTVAGLQGSVPAATGHIPALTEQFIAAAWRYDLSYADIKALAYGGITNAFLNEQDAEMLKGQLDSAFATFEAAMAARADSYTLQQESGK